MNNLDRLSYNQCVEKVVALRKKSGISQRDMAKNLDIGLNTVNRFENDKEYCNFEVLVIYARHFKLTPYIVLG
jgi:DNA-binding XRE family transcriptional regulator